jgi:hypothetical protein
MSPIAGVGSSSVSSSAWTLVLNNDQSLTIQIDTTMSAAASSLAGCAYSLVSTGGTWSASGSLLTITATTSSTETQTGCVQASNDFSSRPATDVNPALPTLAAGAYPYEISGATLTITSGAGTLTFTQE